MFKNTKKTYALIIFTIIILATFFVLPGIHKVFAATNSAPFNFGGGGSSIFGPADAATQQLAQQQAGGNSNVLSRAAGWAADKVLRAVLTLMGYLLSAAASLFIWVIDPKNITQTIGNPVVYQMWAQVRDVVNVAFILMLLFSAFCTIFQVEKYSYKKILLTLIIMDLFFNLSFPIARFIIDVANVLMYYFINALGFSGSDGGIFKQIISGSQLDAILKPPDADLSYLLAGIIFAFLLAVTLLVLGVLLVVRLAVLTVLVIFSSVAFVGSTVPFLSSQASKWWDALFKHAFFGPIMIFMLYVAITMMSKISTATLSAISATTKNQTSTVNSSWLASVVFFAVPIVILWVGLGVAQSLNIAAAGAVTGVGKKVGSWGIQMFSGYRAARYVGVKTGKGIKEGAKALVGAAWNKFDRDVLAKPRTILGKKVHFSLKTWKKSWQEGTKALDEQKFGDAEAMSSDILSSVFKSRRKIPNYYNRRREASAIAAYQKEQESMGKSDKECLDGLRGLLVDTVMDTVEKGRRAVAYLKTLEDGRNLNEVIKQLLGHPIDASTAPADIKGLLDSFGVTGEDNKYHRRQLGEAAMANGDYHLWNLDEDNPATRSNNLQGKLNVVDNQKFQINVHPEAVLQKDDSNTIHGLQGDAEKIVDHILALGGDYLNRNRGGFSTDILSDAGITALHQAANGDENSKYMRFLKLVAKKHSTNTNNQNDAINNINRVTGTNWT